MARVANGERIACPGVIRDASIAIDGVTFHVDLYVMPLAGFDLVLGTQWLATLGPVVWDVAARTLQFQHQGHSICWSGIPAPAPPSLGATTASPTIANDATPAGEPLLDALLGAFGVFAEPQGLPSRCTHDHRITLKPGATPMAV